MPDISLCLGLLNTGDKVTDCPVRNKCHRFTTKGNGIYQAYFEPPEIRENGCNMFWRNDEINSQNPVFFGNP